MKKKVLAILCIISLCVTIATICNTYSKYADEAVGTLESNVAKWNIKLNNTDVTDGNTYNFVIDNFTINGNQNVASGKIAPGMSGYFEINIDPSDTDVSVKYEITINPENFEDSNIHIENVYETGNNTLIKTGEYSYTGVILLEDIQNNITNTIRIEVEWDSISVEDESDYEYALSLDNVLELPVSVNIKQYTGETISPYNS